MFTSLHYLQTRRIVTCCKSGGRIVSGQLIALVDAEGCLEICYHPMNDRGELMTGVCRSTPELLPDGRIRLHEAWHRTSGDGSRGSSELEEER